MKKKARSFPIFFKKRFVDEIPVAGFPGETCTANLYMLGKNAFRPEKVMIRAVFRIEACAETCYIGFHDRIPSDVNTSTVLSLA